MMFPISISRGRKREACI